MAFEHIMRACEAWQKRILQRTSPIASAMAILSKIWRILRGRRYLYNSTSCTKPIDRCLEVHCGVGRWSFPKRAEQVLIEDRLTSICV